MHLFSVHSNNVDCNSLKNSLDMHIHTYKCKWLVGECSADDICKACIVNAIN